MKQPQEYARDLVRLLAGKTDVVDDNGAAILTGAGAAVQDISTFNTESVATLGAAGVFTGTLRDCINQNWAGAVALSDVTGTLYIDEAIDVTPTATNMVQKVVAAATDANAPTPPTAGFQARVAPSKTVWRFIRFRYINGAGVQARFLLNSSLSPLN